VPIGVRHILVINSAPRIAGTRSLPLRGDDLMKLFVYLAFCSLDLESAAGDGEIGPVRERAARFGTFWDLEPYCCSWFLYFLLADWLCGTLV